MAIFKPTKTITQPESRIRTFILDKFRKLYIDSNARTLDFNASRWDYCESLYYCHLKDWKIEDYETAGDKDLFEAYERMVKFIARNNLNVEF